MSVDRLTGAYKGGKSTNGFHLDRQKNVVVHYVPLMPETSSGYWGDKSLCGVSPNGRGFGWTISNRQVNCPKCLKKYELLNRPDEGQ